MTHDPLTGCLNDRHQRLNSRGTSPVKPAPVERSDPAVNETNRRFAICSGDPLDFLDNRDYCLRIGDWAAEE